MHARRVCFLAFSLGATHYLCSPSSASGRLKAVTMAATGHMHKVTKLLYRLCAGEMLSDATRADMLKSSVIVGGMAAGALTGAAALHLNPFGEGADAWLLVPVAVAQCTALLLHDTVIEPPGGWPQPASVAPAPAVGVADATGALPSALDALREPLNPKATTAASTAG